MTVYRQKIVQASGLLRWTQGLYLKDYTPPKTFTHVYNSYKDIILSDLLLSLLFKHTTDMRCVVWCGMVVGHMIKPVSALVFL